MNTTPSSPPGWPWRSLRCWWAVRTLGTQITLVVGFASVVVIGILAWWASGLISVGVTRAVDLDLARAAAVATGKLAAGVPEYSVDPPQTLVDGAPAQVGIRVTDLLGHPLDHGPPLPLNTQSLRQLATGQSVSAPGYTGVVRWLGVVATPHATTPRLVLAATRVIGYSSVVRRGKIGIGLVALLAASLVTLAAAIAVRLALRPVDRMRAAAISLSEGQRLPLPVATDELRELALEINDLLARRDTATDRLRRFTGDAAHELRSPIAAIRAQAEVAVLHPDPELAEDVLRSVATEAARISELVSALLTLARADSHTPPAATPVDVITETRNAITRAEHTTLLANLNNDGEPDRDTDVALLPVITLAAPVPVTAAASPAEMALVLNNLLGNARRYATARIWVSVLPGAGQMVRVIVEDDGPGIPDADQVRVFDRFTRLDPDRGGVTGGAGLGLALVKALVTGRGGTVYMTTSPHGGAKIETHWPTMPPPPRS